MRLIAAIAVSSIAALSIAGCAARSEQPRTIVVENVRARPEGRAEFIDDYEGALASIAVIAERDLRLPKLQGVLHLLADREALYHVLEASGADPVTARGVADRMLAVRRVSRGVRQPDRVPTSQLELADCRVVSRSCPRRTVRAVRWTPQHLGSVAA